MDLLSITLLAPYAPLRDSSASKRNPHFAPRNLELWNSNSPDTTVPASISLSVSPQFSVKFKVPVGYNLVNPKVTGNLKTIPQNPFFLPQLKKTQGDISFESNESPDLTSEPGSMIFKVTVKSWSNEVPWGIDDILDWELRYSLPVGVDTSTHFPWISDHTIFSVSKPAKVTLYALTEDLSTFWMHEGISVQFLNLFVLPTDPYEHPTRDKWIEWVVKKCFGSTYDDDFKNTPGNENFECIHSYRYNTFNGGFNYVAGGETIFKLDDWLSRLAPPVVEGGKIHYNYVNCYDQSALVQTALSLGIPYAFKDNGNEVFKDGHKVKNIGRIYKGAFGFIPASDLVGWGKTDSPFFEEGAKTKLFNQGDVLPVPHERELFKDHSWVYLRRPGPELGYTTLDACAGPASDPALTIEKYLTTHIDVFATKNFDKDWYFAQGDHKKWRDYRKEWTGWKAVKYELFDGVISTEVQPVIIKKGNHQGAKDVLEDVFPELWADDRTKVHPNTARFTPVPVISLVEKVVQTINAAQSPDFYSTWTPFAIGVDGTSVRVDMYAGDVQLTIQVDVLTDFWTAIDWATDYLASFDNDLDDVFDLPEKLDSTSVWDTTRGRLCFTPGEVGGQGLLVRNNVLVKFSGACPVKIMNTTMSAAEAFIINYIGGALEEVTTSKVVVTPQTVTAGENVTFTITGENIVGLDLDFEKHYLYDIQSPIQDPHNPNTWTVECAVHAPKEGEGTFEDNIVVCFAVKDSYYTTTGSWKIQVVVPS